MVTKFENRLQGWQGNMISIGGRLILINFVLSSTPLYVFSIHRILADVLKQLDKIRRNLLYQGTQGKMKYSLVNWHKACLAKEYGDVDILDLRQMNTALLMKWWWKYQDQHYSHLWKKMIQFQYSSNPYITLSPFWKEVVKLESLGQCSVSYQPGSASQVSFWTDCWDHQQSLAVQFPHLYEICTNPHITLQIVIQAQ